MPVVVPALTRSSRANSACAISIVHPVASTSAQASGCCAQRCQKRSADGDDANNCSSKQKRSDLDSTRDSQAFSNNSFDQGTQTDPVTEQTQIVSVSLTNKANQTFSHVVVFVPENSSCDQHPAEETGSFKLVTMHDVSTEATLTDWTLETDMFKNKWRTMVKPVHVRVDGEFVEASLFLRVRKHAPMPVVREVVRTLNVHLDMYKNHVRRGIAEEWNAQEQWRMFPAHDDRPVEIHFTRNDRPDVRQLMKDFLPEGYDAEWDM